MSTRTLAASLALALAAGALVIAGPLNPPAGGVSPTYKTLSDVEPRIPLSQATTPGNSESVFVISQPGSYYLTGNVSGQGTKNIIDIQASGVTIDLSGFRMTYGVDGVTATVGGSDATIRNGFIESMSGGGVDLRSALSNVTVENVNVRGCGGVGIGAGYNTIIRQCRVEQTGAHAYSVGIQSLISHSSAGSAGGAGFRVSRGSRVESSAASSTDLAGFLAESDFASFVDCNASFCNVGFSLSVHSKAERCSSANSEGVGFDLGSASTATECESITSGAQGFVFASQCVVIRCTARSSGTGYAGFWATSSGARIEDCTALYQGYGFYIGGSDNIVARCVARGNTTSNFYSTGTQEIAPVITNPGSTNFAGATSWSNFAY